MAPELISQDDLDLRRRAAEELAERTLAGKPAAPVAVAAPAATAPRPAPVKPVFANEMPGQNPTSLGAPGGLNAAPSAMAGTNVPAAKPAGEPAPFTAEWAQQQYKNALANQPHGIKGVLRNIGEHLTEKASEREANKPENKFGEIYKNALHGELERAEAKKAGMPIPAKAVGGPQIGENGNFWIAQEPAGGGAPIMTDTGVKAHPNTTLTTVEDPNNPGHFNVVAVNKNEPAAGTTTVGGAKPPAGGNPHVQSYVGKDGLTHHDLLDPHTGAVLKHDVVPAGPAGTYQPMLGPNGETMFMYNSKLPSQTTPTPQAPAVPAATGAEGTSTPAPAPVYSGPGARVHQQAVNQFNTQVVVPAQATETSYQKFLAADANPDKKTGASDMVQLALHLGTTLGSVKGAAVGEGTVEEHKDAIGLEDKLKRWIANKGTGDQLSQNQRDEFKEIIKSTRDIGWRIATKEAVRRSMDVPNDTPPDITVKMTNPKTGKSFPVQALKAGEAYRDGLRWAD